MRHSHSFFISASICLSFACSTTVEPGGDGDSTTSSMSSGGLSGDVASGGSDDQGTASGGSGGDSSSGGTQASGSTSGSGGEVIDGTGNAPGSGGETSSGGGCKSADILCEDFESYAAETFPTGGIWQAEDASCEFQQSSFLNRVATDMAHGGTQAFKMTNKSFAACRLAGHIGDHEDFWVKAHVYWDPAISFMDRETIAIDLTATSGVTPQPKDDPAVRFGFRTKQPCTTTPGPQVTIIGFGEEATGCGDLPIPQGKWYCMEAHVKQSAGLLSVKTYLDGQGFQYNSIGKEPVDEVSRATDIHVEYIRLGIFSTGEAMGNAYIDDLAVSTTRVGCE